MNPMGTGAYPISRHDTRFTPSYRAPKREDFHCASDLSRENCKPACTTKLNVGSERRALRLIAQGTLSSLASIATPIRC